MGERAEARIRGPNLYNVNSSGFLLTETPDAEVYDWRLRERRSREYTFRGKGRYRGRRLTNITPRHTASAAVNEGSIKALRTTLPEGHDDALKGLPNRPSIAWLRQIDKNATPT